MKVSTDVSCGCGLAAPYIPGGTVVSSALGGGGSTNPNP